MNDEKVFQLLTETNPVPDPDGLDTPLALTELERRSPIMATDQPSSGNRSNGLLIGAVAAVAVLIVGLGIWAALADDPSGTSTTAVAASSSTSSPSTTAAPMTSTPITPTQSAAVATVVAYYDALNRGDIQAVEAVWEDVSDGDGAWEQILAAAGHRSEPLEPCRVVDVDVGHLGFPIDPDNPETAVECIISFHNDYHSPAGMFTAPRVERFYVTADAKIVASIHDTQEQPARTDPANFWAYNQAFYEWLAVAYPNVYEEIKQSDGESSPGWRYNPEHMAIAIEYIEEFVAQSDVYPIEPDGG